jgi:hypothetical protein
MEGKAMIRTFAAAALLAGLAACQPAATNNAAPANNAVPANDTASAANSASVGGNAANAVSPAPVPAAYDWHYATHGGSGDLDFGDGDSAEGVSLFHLSCLPNSGRVELSWSDQAPATLSAGGQSERFEAGASAALTRPVLQALHASGNLTLSVNGRVMQLDGKPAGKAAVTDFFRYCGTSAARGEPG